jgi:uncharacterized protein YraI
MAAGDTRPESLAMTPFRLIACTILFGLLASAATAAPAYVLTTVNLRSAPGTTNPIMTKIPGGSLVDAANCTDWCEVSWQGTRGFVIATSLDRSGRVPQRRAAGPPRGTIVASGDYMVAAPPPAVVVAPVPYYRPYYYRPGWGYYGRYGYGYRRWRY